MNFLRRNVLLFLVFLTGAAVLIIEVTAVRILSPYYGNTIFTVSSVIGIVLAALSAGYYIGGRLADRFPSGKWFFGIIAVSGLSVLLLAFLNIALLPRIGYGFSLITGPLALAVILFSLPGFLLGTLSPFAVKLHKTRLPEEGVGRVTGEIFFWSTLGSIFGSLATGFIFIPHFGINEILIATGGALTVIGLAGMAIAGLSRKAIFNMVLAVIAGVLLCAFLGSFKVRSETVADVIYSREGVYGKIAIYDAVLNGIRGEKQVARFLMQDVRPDSAMLLDSDEIVYEYAKYYALFRILNADVKEALVLGGGAYTVPKVLVRELPGANVDVAEIEPSLFELGKKYFRVPDTPRLKNYVADGRRFLHDADKKYDLIFGDAFRSIFSVPEHCVTAEFYQLVREKLSANGMFIANLIGSLAPRPQSFILSEIKTFRSVFPNSYFFAVESPESPGSQNFIFAGLNGGAKIDFDDSAVKGNKDPIIRGLKNKMVDSEKLDLAPYPILTDNYAPVEYMLAGDLGRSSAGD